MPPTYTDEGLRAAIALRRDHPDLGVLVFSQYIETRYAAQLLAGRADGVGYLLKDRVAEVRDFIDALTRVAAGETRPAGLRVADDRPGRQRPGCPAAQPRRGSGPDRDR
jgi:DNA-binding NarL/FixJ family response regulator